MSTVSSGIQFINDLVADQSLREEMRNLSSLDALIAAARRRNYGFEVDDLRQAYAEWYKARTGAATSVSAEDLEDLAGASVGGQDYHDGTCSSYADYDDGEKRRNAPASYAD